VNEVKQVAGNQPVFDLMGQLAPRRRAERRTERRAKRREEVQIWPSQPTKTHFCLPTKVRFLNDVCLRQMMLASPMMTASPNDVCLTARWGKHRIIATNGSNIIFAKQMHHIA